MSSTSQYKDFSDLYTGLLNSVRADTSQTATSNQAKRYINIALQDMHVGLGEKFPWAERKAVLVTQPEYTTGTLTVSQGGTALVGVGTTWDTNNAFGVANMRVGGKIQINGGTEVYEITVITDDTNATIGSRFTPADAAAVTYKYFEDEYALASDFLRPIDQQQFSDNIPIDLIDRIQFRRAYVRNYITGKPVVATIVDRDFSGGTTPVRKIRLHKPPDVAYSIPYNYVTSNLAVTSAGASSDTLVNDDDEPIVPFAYRHAILFHALYHWYRDKKDDDRSQEAKAEYTDMIIRVTGATEIGAQRMRLKPASYIYRKKAARPYRSGSNRRYDLNGKFDRFED